MWLVFDSVENAVFGYQLAICLGRFGDFDIERDFGAHFFCGVPLVTAAFALSELSDSSLELERQSPSICVNIK